MCGGGGGGGYDGFPPAILTCLEVEGVILLWMLLQSSSNVKSGAAWIIIAYCLGELVAHHQHVVYVEQFARWHRPCMACASGSHES